jgi:hypothetical protein
MSNKPIVYKNGTQVVYAGERGTVVYAGEMFTTVKFPTRGRLEVMTSTLTAYSEPYKKKAKPKKDIGIFPA